MSMKTLLLKSLVFITLAIILPLFVGGLIYLLWRPSTLLMFAWAEQLGIIDAVMSMRSKVESYNLPYWLLFNLPNGIWTYTFTAIMAYLWIETNDPNKHIYLLMPFAFGVGFEAGQFLNIIPGTYCLGDILAHLFGAIIGYLLIKMLIMRRLIRVF